MGVSAAKRHGFNGPASAVLRKILIPLEFEDYLLKPSDDSVLRLRLSFHPLAICKRCHVISDLCIKSHFVDENDKTYRLAFEIVRVTGFVD